ncbi:MAG: hypothetical protein R3Y07_00765 [Eubacteriales bacterium]
MKKKIFTTYFIGVSACFYIFMGLLGLALSSSHIIVVVLSGVTLVGSFVTMIYVTKKRIDEIRSGEEDDISQY